MFFILVLLVLQLVSRMSDRRVASHTVREEGDQLPLLRVQLGARFLIGVVNFLDLLGCAIIFLIDWIVSRLLNAGIGIWRCFVKAQSQQKLVLDGLFAQLMREAEVAGSGAIRGLVILICIHRLSSLRIIFWLRCNSRPKH